MRPQVRMRGPATRSSSTAVAKGDRLVVHAPDVAHGRHAGLEQGLGSLREHVMAHLSRARELAVQRARRPEARRARVVADQVHVDVDQARQQHPAADVDRALGCRPARLIDRADASVANADGDPLPRRSPGAVEKPTAPEDELARRA